jgi:amino acid adenylation domain-containing protein
VETVASLFEQTVAAHADAVAVEHGDRRWTYAELNDAANRWAGLLVERGVGPERLVGICLERSCDAIVAMLAVLKAGGAFLPLDPQSPRRRLEFMLRDATPAIVITDSQVATLLPLDVAELLNLDREQTRIARQAPAYAERRATPDDLAYAIYTSGSTGEPKAALLAHRGLTLLARTLPGPFGVSFGTRVLQFASLSFDAAICEIFVALTSGATLCRADQRQLTPGAMLVETLRSLEIEQAILSPSVLALCPIEELPRLKTLVVAGEACSSRVASHWSLGRRLVNAYGPTEATVCATWHACPQGQQSAPPIGQLLPYFTAQVLDERGQPTPIGACGELHLAGPALARGYLNRPELTADRFPIIDGVRFYKTGDIVRRNTAGELEFVARADAQVKLRGVRVEPQEIQAVLEQHPAVAATFVDCAPDAGGRVRLIAYVAVAANQWPASAHGALRDALMQRAGERLPVAMLPAEIVILDQLPLTSAGKIDVAALRGRRSELAAQPQEQAKSLPPSTRTERRLLRLWEGVLTVDATANRPIGVSDDFFAVGGDSLKAFDLLARIENEFGDRLQLADLVRRPTVAKLAALLRDGRATSALTENSSSLIALQPHGERRPLFLMSPGSGNVLCYQPLAVAIGADQPVYGLQAPGVDGLREPLKSVHAMASEYLTSIRQLQPTGPYALGGWSFGGIVAYEIACRLRADGEQVTTLALIESGIARSFAVVRAQVSTAEAPKFRLSDGDPAAMFARFRLHGAEWGVLPPSATERQARQIYEVFSANVQALLDYRPNSYPGEMLLLLARDEISSVRHDPEREWARCCSRVSVRRLPGSHFTLLKSPGVAALAKELRAALTDTVPEITSRLPSTTRASNVPLEFNDDCPVAATATLV